MKKLIHGIKEFRKTLLPSLREKFERLAGSQNPDALFITCSDSRVAPNWFASTDPGDLFVIRNVGNMIPPSGSKGLTTGDESEIAAVEFAILSLNVSDIIVCGHSDCGAMHAIHSNRMPENARHLQSWLKIGFPSLERFRSQKLKNSSLSEVNQLSQQNVLQQLEHLKTYDLVKARIAEGRLKIHAWWFNIGKAEVSQYNPETQTFEVIE